ncbi:MAG: hypothetical protein ACOY3P_26220 [Planctomycetota bacterium]
MRETYHHCCACGRRLTITIDPPAAGQASRVRIYPAGVEDGLELRACPGCHRSFEGLTAEQVKESWGS